ncbi:MAG: DNA polymerase [Treponema sp.]|nr:DNA polymerase [Treponema sp.]
MIRRLPSDDHCQVFTMRTVCHINIISFKAAVAAAKDRSLRGRPFVIAGSSAGRSLALDCSPAAIREGITPGTALAIAQRLVRDLIILPLDLPSYDMANRELEKVAAHYAPLWENDGAGNLYLDITGTGGLFGSPSDCSSSVLRDISGKTEIIPAAAVACNKLVSKVATRTIRPAGLIQVQSGSEAEFMFHQDIKILPGMGPGLLRTAAVTGIREIGEVASLSVNEALFIFGKRGPLLRDMARGIDTSRVQAHNAVRRITQRADFDEDVTDETAIRSAIETLAGGCGLKMRNEKSGASALRLAVMYSDGLEAQGFERKNGLLVTDREIINEALRLCKKTVSRRIRMRSIGLALEELAPLGYQPDLFEPEKETESRKLQEAVDKIQNRFGAGKIARAGALSGGKSKNERRLPQGGRCAH